MKEADAALDVLFHPFDTGALAWRAGGALFLRARDGWPLHASARPGLVCEQTYKPEFDALSRSGLSVTEEAAPGDTFPLVLLLPPRQRDEARALFARALDRAGEGGVVVACMHNDEGAKTGQADLARVAGPVSVLSKHHCRVFWTTTREDADDALRAQWRTLDAPRVVAEGLTSRPGVFAWDRVDAASALLAQHLPNDLSGEGADLGAGTGYLAREVLARSPNVRMLDLYEAESRALALAKINLAAHANVGFHWHDVTQGLQRRYDFIVMNPPFHAQGRADRTDIGQRFIEVAAQALASRGRLYLVANRHLPYETVLDARFGQVRTLAAQGGFKVIEAVRA